MGEGNKEYITRESAELLIMGTYTQYYDVLDRYDSYAVDKGFIEARMVREIFAGLTETFGIVTKSDRKNLANKVHESMSGDLKEASVEEINEMLKDCNRLAKGFNLNIQHELSDNLEVRDRQREAVEYMKARKASTTLVVTRNTKQADMNDSAKLYVMGKVVAEFTNVQSEKNYRVEKHGQTPAQSHEPDYVDKTFPNATLPVGEYTATLISGNGSSYKNPISITSEDAQLPGFSEKGIKADWAFLIHSRSGINEPRTRAYSWGCQIFSDADKEKLDSELNKLGFKVGEAFKLIIE